MTSSPSLAFVFPGQGSQSLGMLAELAESHAAGARHLREASEGAGVDLWTLSQAGPEESSTAPNTPSRRCSPRAWRYGALWQAARRRATGDAGWP